ncbi:MAG: TolC family protein [Gemmataceae bacterium]|nr:TolC family protein [Gemmataceae bacterium]
MTGIAPFGPFAPLAACCLALALSPALAHAQDAAAPDAASPAIIAVTPLSLSQCIDLGMANQPALDAARASLAAAHSGYRGLNNIGVVGRIVAKDLPIRQQQACIGIGIAEASLIQAEWETRYAVRRTFYSVQYARHQKTVLESALTKLKSATDKAVLLEKAGDPEFKVTKIDIDVLNLNGMLLKSKLAEATVGIQKAVAALREAMGVGPDYPLEVAVEPLPAIVESLDKETLIASAIANRGELVQANSAQRLTELEIAAQSKIRSSAGRTFAAGSDIHAKPIPQGVANGEYRPGAIGIEMPTTLAGPKADRMARASDLSARAAAVSEKAHNLVSLETEVAYLKWLEASTKVRNLKDAVATAARISESVSSRFETGRVSGEELLRARTLEEQTKALYNEAFFQHALALAGLERVTAGAFRVPD